jgi:hypothetical protein
VLSIVKRISKIPHKATVTTETALTTVTAGIFNVQTVQIAGLLIALTASHNLIFKQTVTALVLITVIFSRFLTTVTVIATALKLSVPSSIKLA